MKKSNLLFALAFGSLIAISASADDEAIVMKARELRLTKKNDEALKLYQENTKDTASERLYVDYASLLLELKKFDECEEILGKVVTAYPESTRIKNALAMAKHKNGKNEEASALLKEVLAKDPENKFAKSLSESLTSSKPAEAVDASSAKDDNSVAESFSEESNGAAFKVSNELTKEQQEELAKKLYTEMIDLDKWEIERFISLHRQVIEKCPLTDNAQESCWRLSNLYLLGTEPVEYDNCIAVLEHLLKQYPDTPLMPDAKNRLLVVCDTIGDYTRVIALYDELFQKDPEPDDKTFMIRALEYGNALSAAGKTEEAKSWYMKVIEKDAGKNQLEARAAAKKIGQL